MKSVRRLDTPHLPHSSHALESTLTSTGVEHLRGGERVSTRKYTGDEGTSTYNSDTVTERPGREVLPELAAHHTAVSVGAGDLSPNDPDLGSVDGSLGRVDVCQSLENRGTQSALSHVPRAGRSSPAAAPRPSR
jgi:hypothetical protein